MTSREAKESGRRPDTELRDLRVAAGLTQAQLADAVGVTQGMISAAELGRKPLGRATRLAALRALGVDVRPQELAEIAADLTAEQIGALIDAARVLSETKDPRVSDYVVDTLRNLVRLERR